MSTAPPPIAAGMLVAGRFRVERQIGEGAMGSVWAGRHVSLDQLVAIKFIHPKLAGSPDALRRFYTEAKAAARIKSRHAVSVYDHGVTKAGQPYIVMEYLEGQPLEAAIVERGPLPLEEVAEIVGQAASALAVAHDAGVVHRDLKPDNIFLAADSEAKKFGYTVKLVDFGIAKIVHDEAASGAAATQAGAVVGTPHYMSPEALTASAPVSAASDVWSLAACAFAAACARIPFPGDAIGEVVLKVIAAPLPVPSKINPRLPKAFDSWFAKACSRNASERFPSVRELAGALNKLEQWQRAQREEVSYEIRPTRPSLLELDLPEPRTPGRSLLLAGLLVGAALTIGVLGYYVYQRTRLANEAIARASASAAAAIEAENDKKLGAADRAFWASVNEAGAEASTSSSHASAGRRKKSRLHRSPAGR